jgi:hypothetical protein
VLHTHVNLGSGVLLVGLDGVADEVVQQASQLWLVGHHRGQFVVDDDGATFLNRDL